MLFRSCKNYCNSSSQCIQTTVIHVSVAVYWFFYVCKNVLVYGGLVRCQSLTLFCVVAGYSWRKRLSHNYTFSLTMKVSVVLTWSRSCTPVLDSFSNSHKLFGGTLVTKDAMLHLNTTSVSCKW
jgi:hypothetical protein